MRSETNGAAIAADLARRRCWLFDMDGTLTRAMHDFDAMRTALGLPAGVPILEALAALEPSVAREKRRALDAMELDMARAAVAQPGAAALLGHLASRGARLGIVTRNGRAIADATLAACDLARFFTPESIVSRDCAVAKPDPAGVRVALSRLGASPVESVMVGDYRFDLEAGRRGGLATVHLDVAREFPWPGLTDLGIGSLDELLEALRRADDRPRDEG